MDQSVRQEILLNLEQETDLDDTQRELLIQVVEDYEQEVTDLMTSAMGNQPQSDPADLMDEVLQDFMDRGRLDGKAEFLWDPSDEVWGDITQCESTLTYTFQLWMLAEWCQ